MTQRNFLTSLARIAALGAGLALALRLAFGAGWWSFYGPALAVLVTLPFVTRLLWQRFAETGRSGWRALLYAVPAGALALTQIGYWWAFFSYGPANPMLGIAREMMRMNLGSFMPWLAAALLALWTWLLVSAARDRA